MMEFDFLSAARDLIGADSVSKNGNLEAVEVLEGIAHGLGLESFRQEAHALGVPQANLIVHPRGAKPKNGSLLLVTHTDTVGSGPLDLWTKTNPWVLAQEGDTLYGLGVADVKLDALAKLRALALAPAEAAGKVAFCGTFAEEVGCLGAKHFLANRPFEPAWVSCGEPSELRIIDAHKGYLVAHIHLRARPEAVESPRLRLTFQGKAAHSSTPHLGVNAIELAFAFCASHGLQPLVADGGDLANKVPARCVIEVEAKAGVAERARQAGVTVEELQRGRPSAARAIDVGRKIAAELQTTITGLLPAEDRRFDPATAVYNHNVISTAPDGSHVEVTCDARLLPGHDPLAIFTRLDGFAARLAAEAGIEVEIERGRSNPAMALPAQSRLRDEAMAASRALGLNPTPEAKPTNTEGGVFVSAGLEAIVFGPGRSTGNAHTANEYQSLSQIQDASRWYEQLIRNLCQ